MSKARDLANAGTALTTVSATELGYVDGVTSAIQTQLDAKAASSTAATLTGTQTLTNKTLTSPVLTTPTISTVDAKGDLLAGTADNTVGRLAVGTNGQLLSADSTAATGLAWTAAPAAGSMTLLSTTPLTGGGGYFNVTGISQAYLHLFITVTNVLCNANTQPVLYFNAGANNLSGTVFTGSASNVWQNSSQNYISDRNWRGTGGNNAWSMMVYNYANTTSWKTVLGSAGFVDNSTGSNAVQTHGGVNTSNSAITAVYYNWQGNGITQGTLKIYGVN